MYEKVGRALLMNKVQRVPYYRMLWWEHRTDLLFFDPAGIDWERQKVDGLLLHKGRWLQGRFAFPEAIYNRCYPEPETTIQKFSEIMGAENIFNDRTHFDKWEVYQQLSGSEVGGYLPQTYRYDENELPDLLTKHHSFIFKPRLGHGGAGVIKVIVLSPNLIIFLSQWGVPIPLLGQCVFLPLLLVTAPPSLFIAQEFIESLQSHDRKFDVRIVMQKNKVGQWEVGGELSRVTVASNLLTNHYEAVVSPTELVSSSLLQTMQSLSLVVAQTLDGEFASLGELGVDFLIDEEGKPWILEINGKPDKSLFWQIHDDKMLQQIYLNPLNYQDYLLKL